MNPVAPVTRTVRSPGAPPGWSVSVMVPTLGTADQERRFRGAARSAAASCPGRDALALGLVHGALVGRDQAGDRERLEPLDDLLELLRGGPGLLVRRPHHRAEQLVELLGQ